MDVYSGWGFLDNEQSAINTSFFCVMLKCLWINNIYGACLCESLTSSFLTDEAVGGGSAGIRSQARHQGFLQVSTEPRVTRLTRKPAQAAVGEGRHVLPAPVGHVDFPQTHPRRQTLKRQRQKVKHKIMWKALPYSNVTLHLRSASALLLQHGILGNE